MSDEKKRLEVPDYRALLKRIAKAYREHGRDLNPAVVDLKEGLTVWLVMGTTSEQVVVAGREDWFRLMERDGYLRANKPGVPTAVTPIDGYAIARDVVPWYVGIGRWVLTMASKTAARFWGGVVTGVASTLAILWVTGSLGEPRTGTTVNPVQTRPAAPTSTASTAPGPNPGNGT